MGNCCKSKKHNRSELLEPTPRSSENQPENSNQAMIEQESLQSPAPDKVVIKTNIRPSNIQILDVTPSNSLKAVYRYTCPICLSFLTHILATECCKQYICHYCINQLKEENLKFDVKCPHCNALPLVANDVDQRKSIRKYFDSNNPSLFPQAQASDLESVKIDFVNGDDIDGPASDLEISIEQLKGIQPRYAENVVDEVPEDEEQSPMKQVFLDDYKNQSELQIDEEVKEALAQEVIVQEISESDYKEVKNSEPDSEAFYSADSQSNDKL